MLLRGNRCRCSGCGEYFNSEAAFSKHRVGEYTLDPKTRGCLTRQGMKDAGMAVNEAGFWVTALWDKNYRLRGVCRSPTG